MDTNTILITLLIEMILLAKLIYGKNENKTTAKNKSRNNV